MKNMYIFCILSIIIFSGCETKKNQVVKIEKVGKLTYEFVDEIVKNYPLESKRTVEFAVYKRESEFFKSYDSDDRIGIHYRLVPSTNDSNQAIIDLCNNKERLHIGDNSTFAGTIIKDKVSSYYLPVELLKEKGFISQETQMQKDICLYFDNTSSLMSGDVHYGSNTITYTAEEINLFLDTHNLR